MQLPSFIIHPPIIENQSELRKTPYAEGRSTTMMVNIVVMCGVVLIQ